MKNLKLLSLALILISTQAEAVIINVPAQYNTIQSAINVSNNSDTILVQPGTYFENINFRGKSIVLTSKYYLNSDYSFIESTIINGSNPVYPDSASCVVMGNHEDSNTVLQGFTLTGGTGTKWLDIHNGFYYTEGGGIIMEFASPTIRNNIIRDNEAINISNGSKSSGGGAIRCGDSNPKILNNLIINNRGRYGAGIVFNYSAGLVKNNVILKNYGGEDYGGAGIWMVGTNSATVVTIENNTIVQNRSVGPNARGGAVQVFSIRAVIINNIVWGNTQTIGLQINTSGGGIVNATYNNVQGGFTGAGNIDINPLFDSTNFYLNNNSPCIDKGDSSIIYNDPPDQNNPLIAKWPSKGSVRNDIGAYGGPGSKVIAGNLVEIRNHGNSTVPSKFYLAQNYPNPFNPKTIITFTVPPGVEGIVKLIVYDALGKEIAELMNESKSAGKYSVVFDTGNEGKNISSGILFYSLQVNDIIVASKKMILLK